MEEMPKVAITVVTVLIIFALGVFAFYIVNNEIGYEEIQTEYFGVTDPTVAKVCHLTYAVESIASVYQYNGYNWIAVAPGDYTVAGQTVTVLPAGMQG